MATIEIHGVDGSVRADWLDLRDKILKILNDDGFKKFSDIPPPLISNMKNWVIDRGNKEYRVFLRVYFESDEPRVLLGRLKELGLRIEVKYLDQVISAPVAGKKAG